MSLSLWAFSILRLEFDFDGIGLHCGRRWVIRVKRYYLVCDRIRENFRIMRDTEPL